MSPDRVVVDTGVIMAVVAYRSKHLIPVFDKARNEDDLEVLYSADMLDADILIASDRDFFDKERPPRGIRARIMRPSDYLKRRR